MFRCLVSFICIYFFINFLRLIAYGQASKFCFLNNSAYSTVFFLKIFRAIFAHSNCYLYPLLLLEYYIFSSSIVFILLHIYKRRYSILLSYTLHFCSICAFYRAVFFVFIATVLVHRFASTAISSTTLSVI